jgi:hypothetical protein
VNDPDIIPICADQADFWGSDCVVDSGASVALWRRVMWSAGYGFLPSMVNRV